MSSEASCSSILSLSRLASCWTAMRTWIPPCGWMSLIAVTTGFLSRPSASFFAFASRTSLMSLSSLPDLTIKGRVATDGCRVWADEATMPARIMNERMMMFFIFGFPTIGLLIQRPMCRRSDALLRAGLLKQPLAQVLCSFEIIVLGGKLASVSVLVIKPRITKDENRTLTEFGGGHNNRTAVVENGFRNA